MTTPKIAVQARIWGLDDLAVRFPSIFDEAIKTGYAGAESRVGLLDQEEAVLRYLANNPSFSLIALHTNLKSYDVDDKRSILGPLLEKMNKAGSQYLVASMGRMPEFTKWFELAAEVTELCAEHRVQFCYHNHAGEFERGYEFFDGLARYKVAMAADLAWVSKGGKNAVEFIDRFADHIKYVHVKDYSGDKWKELGEGQMELKQTLQRLAALNLPWWTVEQDDTDQNPTVSATISRNYIKNQFGY